MIHTAYIANFNQLQTAGIVLVSKFINIVTYNILDFENYELN